MALEDFMDREVGIAVAVTAAVASPKVRGVLRRGAVYGLAGILKAGDAVTAVARGVRRGAQEASVSSSDVPAADGAPVAADVSAAAAAEPADAPHKRARKSPEAANGE